MDIQRDVSQMVFLYLGTNSIMMRTSLRKKQKRNEGA